MAKRSATFSSHSEQQPRLKRKQRPPTSALYAPRKQESTRAQYAIGDDDDDSDMSDEESCNARAGGGDNVETACEPCSFQKKRSRPQSLEKRDDDSAFQERPTLHLVGRELNQFQQWIKRSADEPPAVVGAGTAKKTQDSELRMFRDSRILMTSSKCPSVFPVDMENRTSSNSSNRKRSLPLGSEMQRQQQRPHSWEQSSPPRKSVHQNMDKLLREKLSTQLAPELVTLPLLKSPTRNIAKDKATMLDLLAECKAYVVMFLVSDWMYRNGICSQTNPIG